MGLSKAHKALAHALFSDVLGKALMSLRSCHFSFIRGGRLAAEAAFDAVAQRRAGAAEQRFDAVEGHLEFGGELFAAPSVAVKAVDRLASAAGERLAAAVEGVEELVEVAVDGGRRPDFLGGGELDGGDLSPLPTAEHQQLVAGRRAEVPGRLAAAAKLERRAADGEEGFLRQVVGVFSAGAEEPEVAPDVGLVVADQAGEVERLLGRITHSGHESCSAGKRGRGCGEILGDW